MQLKLQTTLKILLKTSILGMASASLIGSGDTYVAPADSSAPKAITALHVTGNLDNTANKTTAGQNTLTFLKNGTDITMTRAGKTYNFTAADLTTTNGKKDYNITAGDEKVNVQNISTEFLQAGKNYTTNNVDVWFATISNAGKKTSEKGYFVVGTVATALPTTGTTTFKGGMTGYAVSKGTGAEVFLLGDTNLTADFATQKFSGGFSNIADADDDPLGADIEITNGALTSNGFTGDLKFAGGAAAKTGTVSGNFYGTDSSELGGVGQIDNDDAVFSFGFTAKKQLAVI